MKRFGLGALVGALCAVFLDPANGKRRRHTLRDRTRGTMRRGARRTVRVARGLAAETYGLAQKTRHLHQQPKDYDDATLKAKVETELFRPEHAPKGRVNVNAQNGIVQLRGELDSRDLIEDLVHRTRKIQGVRDVENLLHLVGEEAPMHH
jgi:osmotically-inducible protein OsmY